MQLDGYLAASLGRINISADTIIARANAMAAERARSRTKVGLAAVRRRGAGHRRDDLSGHSLRPPGNRLETRRGDCSIAQTRQHQRGGNWARFG